MPTEREKAKIREMAAEGKSVNSITEKTDIPKSTVYYHFRKEVGQKQKRNRLEIPENTEVQGEICGVFAGDGSYYRDTNHKYRIKFTLNIEDSYWKMLAKFLETQLEKSPRINHQKDYSRTNLRYESKRLLQFLQSHLEWEKKDKTGTICLEDGKRSQEFKIGFLRGLLDTDGYQDTTRRRYCFSTASNPLAENIATFLDDLDINFVKKQYIDERGSCRSMNRLYINGQHTERLSSVIKPRHPKKQGY